MASTDNLLPCPFCAGPASLDSVGKGGSRTYAVFCNDNQCPGVAHGCAYGAEAQKANAILRWNTRSLPPSIRDFLGKVQGVCMGVAMSGRDHPNPDGALMELFNEAQAILFPPATSAKGCAE